MQNNAATTNDNIPSNLSDEQIDKFFATGGKEESIGIQSSVEKEEPQAESQNNEISEAPKEQPKQEVIPENKELISYKAALQEEREKRKDLQKRFHDNELKQAKMEERLQAIIEAAKAPQHQERIPTYDENPLEALRFETERMKQIQMQQLAIEQQRLQQHQFSQSQNEFINRYRNDALEYSKEASDFKEAYQHLVNARKNEYKAAGYSEGQANQLLIEDEMAIAAKAYQDGANPAQRVYELAKLRGYQKGIEVPSESKTKNDNVQKFETIQKTINNSKTLSGASGGKVDKGFSLESVATLDDDDFASITPSQWKKLISNG